MTREARNDTLNLGKQCACDGRHILEYPLVVVQSGALQCVEGLLRPHAIGEMLVAKHLPSDRRDAEKRRRKVRFVRARKEARRGSDHTGKQSELFARHPRLP